MYKKQGDFELTIEPGSFKTSQITVLLGENGTGKTTFIKMLAEAGKKKKTGKEAGKEQEKENPGVIFFIISASRNEHQLQASNNRS